MEVREWDLESILDRTRRSKKIYRELLKCGCKYGCKYGCNPICKCRKNELLFAAMYGCGGPATHGYELFKVVLRPIMFFCTFVGEDSYQIIKNDRVKKMYLINYMHEVKYSGFSLWKIPVHKVGIPVYHLYTTQIYR